MCGMIIEEIEERNDLFEFAKGFNDLSNERKDEILDQEADYNGGNPNGRSPLHRKFSHYNFS